MKKKIWSIALLSVGTILLSILMAYGITTFFRQKNVEETGNVLGVAWYDPKGEEFVITTKEELYELAKLSDFYTFENQTIKLGADIVINEGDAAEWSATMPKERWVPISNFSGVFDGQGHSISGLYGKSLTAPMGLFIYTKGSCTVQNLKLTNSYFETRGSSGTGSFSGVGDGNFVKLYSDAIIHCKGETAGGIVGCIKSKATLDECWYDGSIQIKAREGGGLVATIENGRVTIKHCLFSGNLVSEHSFDATRTGGIVGRVDGVVGLNISDSLVSGELTMAGAGYSGRVIGVAYGGAQIVISDTYDGATCNQTNSIASGATTGAPIRIENSRLSGIKAYQWTTLDFEKYWSVVESGTPVLKCFAQQEVDITGVEKAYDISWYSKEHSSFTLTDAKQLYGLSMLAFSTDFKGVVIRLDNDIVLNEGNAKKWANQPTTAPEITWTPIGSIQLPFAGTFDGQGHTISGMYINESGNYKGLFGCTYIGSMIKNFKLTNSAVVAVNEKKVSRIGGAVGESWGSLDSIYSDVTIVAFAETVGGIAGRLNYMDTTYNNPNVISNCWYDGEISLIKGGRTAGGIVGEAGKGSAPKGEKVVHTLSNCLFTGTIKSDREPNNVDKVGGQYIGGILGQSGNYTVRINDCLSAGEIDTVCTIYVGSVFGRVRDGGGIIEFNNTYATAECWKEGYAKNATIKGDIIYYPKNVITGYGGYQNTMLDFDNYWSVAKQDTPVLKSFATEKVKLTGVAKKVDTSWYQPDKKTYIIDSVEDLYGFWLLSQYNNFDGKVVTLGADIVVNEANEHVIETWRKGNVVPENTWTPIGQDRIPFAGTFDGKGHTISGIYLKSDKESLTYSGLFSVTADGSRIQNFRLEKSYFERTGQSEHIALMGSVAGETRGTIDSVYSDAILVTDGQIVGGIVGRMSYANADYAKSLNINNCWFAGEIDGGVKFVGGIVGALSRGAGIKEYEKAIINITNCLNTGYITNARKGIEDGFGGQYLAGIVGADWMDCVLNIEKCVNAGKIDLTFKVYAGAIFSRKLSANSKITIRDSYAVKEAYSPVYGGEANSIDNRGKLYNKLQLSDTLALAYMDVDFKNIWLAVNNETPVLRSFANGEPEVYEDFAWYKDKTSLYEISTEEQLKSFARMVNAGDTFKDTVVQLKKDMYLNGSENAAWIPSVDSNGVLTNVPENQWISVGNYTNSAFEGTFTGLDGDVIHSISGVYVNQETAYAGLFGSVGAEGTIENLKLTNSYIGSTSSRVGAIAGTLEGNASNVYVDENVTVKGADSVGGITGNFGGGHERKITNCWVAAQIYNSAAHTGAVAGVVYRGNKTISDCLFTGTIQSFGDRVGGLVGFAFTNSEPAKLKLQDCVMAGMLSASKATTVGGTVAVVDANVNLKSQNVYTTDKRIGSIVDGASVLGQQMFVTSDELKGNNAYIYTAIAFCLTETDDKEWIATEGGVELTLFSENAAVYNLGGQKVDTTWYYNTWDGKSGKTYEINNLAKMYGFERIVNSGVNFKDDTIQLTTDLHLNGKGSTEWVPTVDVNGSLTNAPSNQWKPMGTNVNPFRGTFTGLSDDKIHSISGLYVNSSVQHSGLFGYIGAEAVVENLVLQNSYVTSSLSRVGVVSGGCDGNINNIYIGKDVIVKGSDSVGGIVGFFGEGYVRQISNCWVAGKIYNTTAHAGAIAGVVYRGEKTISNCLFTGTINSSATSNPKIGGLIGYAFTNATQSKLFLKNCVVNGTFVVKNTSSTGAAIGRTEAGLNLEIMNVYSTYKNTGDLSRITSLKGKTKILTAQELSGKGSYVNTALPLCKSSEDSEAWVATGKGPQLALFTEETPVYQLSGQRVDTSWYYNEWTNAVSNVYHINTEADLYGFGKIVREGVDVFANQKVCLDKDLDLNPGWKPNVNAKGQLTNSNGVTAWTSIGTTSAATSFKGTFDGQGHSVSGMYQVANVSMSGMFARLEVGSVVKNLKIINSYFSSTAPSSTALSTWDVGSVAGCAQGDLSNIYSNAIVVSNTWDAGGMIGRLRCTASGEVRKIEGCWFDGQLLVTGNNELCKSNAAYGGIVGRLATGAPNNVCTYEFTNCLNTGIVKRTAANTSSYVGYVAGIVGGEFGTYSPKIKMTDCLNVGEVSDPGNFKGGLIGIMRAQVTMTDCYSTKESSIKAVGQFFNGATINGSSTFKDTDYQVTRESILLNNAKIGAAGLFNNESTEWACDTVSSEKRGTPILSYFADWWKTGEER